MARYLKTYSRDPFRNMIDDFFNASIQTPARLVQSSTFKVDILKDETGYTIEAEAPGFEKSDIAIEFDKGYLTINMQRTTETSNEDEADDVSVEDNNVRYIHRERSTVQMSRSMNLGEVDEQNITANLDKGVLTIRVPFKPEEVEVKKRIEIQ